MLAESGQGVEAPGEAMKAHCSSNAPQAQAASWHPRATGAFFVPQLWRIAHPPFG